MFAVQPKIQIVTRVSLISVVLFNALASSTAFAQAKQESGSTASSDTRETEQRDRSIPAVESAGRSTAKAIESQLTAGAELQPVTKTGF